MPDRTKPTRLVSRSQEQAFLECHSDGRQWRHAGIVGAPEWMPPHGMHGAFARRSVCTSGGTAPDDYAPSRQDYRKRLVADLFAEVEQAERGA
jgi:hypothetical protein